MGVHDLQRLIGARQFTCILRNRPLLRLLVSDDDDDDGGDGDGDETAVMAYQVHTVIHAAREQIATGCMKCLVCKSQHNRSPRCLPTRQDYNCEDGFTVALARTDDSARLFLVLGVDGPESNGRVGSRGDDDALVYRRSRQVHDFLSFH